MPPSRNDNDLGFWEGKHFHSLNEEILVATESSWNDWSPLDLEWIDTSFGIKLQKKAEFLLKEEYEESDIIIIKDPRICRLFPFWVKVLKNKGIEPVVILPIRNPLEVAASLERRNRIDVSHSLLSWLRHVLEAESGSRTLPRVFVQYKDLLANWRKVTDHIALELGLQWPLEGTTADAEINAFLSPELRHHVIEDAEVFQGADIADWIRDTFEILARWTRKDIRHEDQVTLDRIRHAFDAAHPVFRNAVALGQHQLKENQRLEKTLKERDGEEKTFQARLEAMAGQQQAMAQKQAALEMQLTERERTQKTLETRLETETRQREAAAQQWAVLEARLAERERALQEHEVQLKTEIAQRERSTQKVAELEARLAEREQTFQYLETRLQAEIKRQESTRGQLAVFETRLAERERLRLELEAKLEAEVGHHQAAARQGAIFEGRLEERERIVRSLETKLAEIAQQHEVLLQNRTVLEAQLAQSQKTQQHLAERLETESKKRQHEVVVLSKLLVEKGALAGMLEGAFHKMLVSLQSCSPGSLRWRVALIKESRLFDEAWYLSHYPDIADDPAARADPFGHFIAHGWREGRAANAIFAGGAGEGGLDARKTDDSPQTAFERGPEDPS